MMGPFYPHGPPVGGVRGSLIFCIIFILLQLVTKFEVCGFSRSKDIEGSQTRNPFSP